MMVTQAFKPQHGFVHDLSGEPLLQELRDEAQHQGLTIYLSSRQQRDGGRFVHVRQGKATLSEHWTLRDALAWLRGGQHA